MRRILFGVIFTLVVLVLSGLGYALLGYVQTAADATPPAWEQSIAMRALDASMDRHAPRVTNPVPPTDENLIEGMKVYTMNCALCHGSLNNQPSPLRNKFYPRVPQLIIDPLDDPEWHIYFAVRTGVRNTGMPAWNGVLTDDQMWKVTAFLSRLDKLSPGVQDYWKNSFGTAPQAHTEEEHHDHSKH